jgi:hypothetical protein
VSDPPYVFDIIFKEEGVELIESHSVSYRIKRWYLSLFSRKPWYLSPLP